MSPWPLLPGLYALEMHMVTTAKVPLLGKMPTVSTTYAMLDVHEAASGLQATHRVCRTSFSSPNRFVKTSVPDVFVEHLPVKTYDVAFVQDGDGWSMRVNLGVDRIGFDASVDDAPTAADQPGVVDYEGDGHPGATANVDLPIVGRSQIYFTQRGNVILAGHIAADETVHGPLLMQGYEQNTIGATNRVMMTHLDIRHDPARSWFDLRPLPPGSTCEALK